MSETAANDQASPGQDLVVMVDCMALVYRGHFAMIRNPRVTSSGLNTSALFVVANTLLELRDKHQATHLVMVADSREPTFRHERYPELQGAARCHA